MNAFMDLTPITMNNVRHEELLAEAAYRRHLRELAAEGRLAPRRSRLLVARVRAALHLHEPRPVTRYAAG